MKGLMKEISRLDDFQDPSNSKDSAGKAAVSFVWSLREEAGFPMSLHH